MPHFSTDLIRRRRKPADRHECDCFILFLETAGRQLVACCCRRSAEAGVRPGMTVAHARALLPPGRMVIEPRRPQRELAALEALARWCLRFSPIVAVDPPDGLLIDVAGCERLFGGGRRLVGLIAAAVDRFGFGARIAAAPTFACAWAVARFGSGPMAIVTTDDRRETLSALPVESLRVGGTVVDALREVGIEQVGHLLNLPRSSLPARFGAELLRRLDQVMGRAPETVDPVRPAAPPAVERLFAGPVTQLQAVELTVRQLLGELAGMLEQRECGARRIQLRLDRIDAEPLSMTISLSRPGRSARHLWSLLGPRVESINLGWGVERVRLTATRLGRLPHREAAWTWADGAARDDGRRDRDLGELLDTLSNRLGPDRVVRAEPVETHLPERAFQFRPVMEEERHGGTKARRHEAEAEPRAPSLSPRPSLLLERPEPIAVIAMTPDGPPSWLRWRGMEQRITASAGPERIAGEWWRGERGAGAQGRRGAGETKSTGRAESYARAYGRFLLGREDHSRGAQGRRGEGEDGPLRGSMILGSLSCAPAPLPLSPTRDYFKVQDERGRWLWIYRVLENGRWFIHGLWA